MPRLAKIILMFALICSPRLSHAANLTLAWDPPSEGVVAGYIISYGTVSRAYSLQANVGNTTSYTLNGLSVGTTYYFVVSAYDATGRTSAPSAEISVRIAPPVVTALSLTASVPPPQVAGTSVTWRAVASGGVAPYQFQWSLYTDGKWTVNPWTTASAWTWKPSAPGAYQVRVAVRSSGSSSTAGEMVQSVPFTVTAPPIAVTLLPSVAAPQKVSTTIRWSAAATGSATGYQYRWFLFNGIAWSPTTAWTTSSTWSWVPSLANDAYIVAVWVRKGGNSIDAPEAGASAPFSIKP